MCSEVEKPKGESSRRRFPHAGSAAETGRPTGQATPAVCARAGGDGALGVGETERKGRDCPGRNAHDVKQSFFFGHVAELSLLDPKRPAAESVGRLAWSWQRFPECRAFRVLEYPAPLSHLIDRVEGVGALARIPSAQLPHGAPESARRVCYHW